MISVAGMPSSIDNDIPFFDKSFGFETAIAESVPFITAANVEAEGCELGIGIVRIMGQKCGFVAATACLASRDVNICVIPEIHFQIYGNYGVYESIIRRAKVKGHCIIVVAEGAYKGLVEADQKIVLEKTKGATRKDDEEESFVDLAAFMKTDLKEYASKNHKVSL